MLKVISVFMMILSVIACGEKAHKSHRQAETQEVAVIDQNAAAMANVDLGIAYLERGENTRARAKLLHALELAPRLDRVHSALAYYYEMVGEIANSAKHHKKAISYTKLPGAMYNNYGVFLCRRGKIDAAKKAFTTALADAKYDKVAAVYENQGICELKGEEFAAAAESFRTAIQRDPQRERSYIELAKLELAKGEFNSAKKLFMTHKKYNALSATDLVAGYKIAKAAHDNNLSASLALQLKDSGIAIPGEED